METNSESQDLLVKKENSGGLDNEGSDLSDCHDSSEQLSLSPAGSTAEAAPSYTPEPQVPAAPSSTLPQDLPAPSLLRDLPAPTLPQDAPSSSIPQDLGPPSASVANDTAARTISAEDLGGSSEVTHDAGQSLVDGEVGGGSGGTSNAAVGPRMGHSRGASQVSSCEPSLGRMSGREFCHSRGASTDGSTMDAYPYSASDSRRGTYSEAGTLPIGSTIIEENMQGWGDRESEKKLSDSEEVGTTYSRKLVASCDCCQAIMRSHHELREQPTTLELVKYAFTCPPHGIVGDCLMWLMMVLALWGVLISVTGEKALPGGNFFSLMILYLFAVLGGKAVMYAELPSLLGSLVVGIIFSSVPGINIIGSNLDKDWSSALRNIALVIILIRAGLGLDPVALRRLSCIVLRLAFMPCIVEACSMGIVSKFLLDLPWSWSFMLGFIVAAVSPAVVVPCLLKLGEDGYGVEQGIPTLVIAAASMDDVLAITGFSVMLGITFAEGSATWTVLKGPFEILTGIIYGIVLGVMCWYLPYKEKKKRALYKLVLLLGLGCLAMFGSKEVTLDSAGAIGVLTVAFVAGLGWRRPGNEDASVSKYFRALWEIFQPLLFSLIGAEINVLAIDSRTIGWGLLALVICLTLRVATSFVVVIGATFTMWERLFIAIAWLPKATVQAAIGSMALDYVRSHGADPEDLIRGEQVVTIAVMVILVTAPIGAAAIKLTGPKFLARKLPSSSPQNDSETPV